MAKFKALSEEDSTIIVLTGMTFPWWLLGRCALDFVAY